MDEGRTVASDNPFPGLRPFEPEETHLFFGRDGQSAAIIAELERARFVAVVGTSGSGKSSLVKAGLLPQLEGGFMSRAGSFWRIALMKPGDAPIRNLARTLASPRVLGEGAQDSTARAAQLEAVLRRGSLGLIDAVRQARLEDGDNVLVVVDQFEELFRMARLRAASGQDEAAGLVALLLEASKQKEVPIYVVLTMRSDFLGDCAQFRGLPEALNHGQYLVPRMSRDERRAAIEGPVAVGGARIAPRLVQQILNDVGDDPDQLPVMQHALMRTWETWKDDGKPDATIDLEHYRRIGSLDKALSDHADTALAELTDPADQAIARIVFQRLCERTADYRETRRPTRLSELCEVANAPQAKVVAVIDKFRSKGRTFLVPPWPARPDPDTVIDISHEALIRQWGVLRKWVDEEAGSAAMYQRLAVDAALHAEGKVSHWRDPQLRAALAWREKARPTEAWARRYHPGFAAAMEFLDKSASAQKRTVFWKTALYVLVPLMLVATGIIWKIIGDNEDLANQKDQLEKANKDQMIVNAELKSKQQTIEIQRDELGKKAGLLETQAEDLKKATEHAQEQASIAESATRQAQKLGREAMAGKLAVQSLIESDSETASLLALEALRFARTDETQAALWQALTRPRQLAPLRHEGLRTMALSADGKRVATIDNGDYSGVALWEAASGRQLGMMKTPHGSLNSVVVSATGDRVFVAGSKPYLSGYEARDGQLRRMQLAPEQPHAATVTHLSLSPDGRLLATGDNSGQVALWDVSTGLRLRQRLSKHDNNVVDLAFDPGGRWLASAGRDRRIHVSETATGQVVTSFSVEADPQVRFTRDAIVVLAGNAVHIRKAPTFAVALGSDDTRNRNQRALFVGPSGRSIYSAGTDGSLLSWAVADDRLTVRSANGLSRFGGARNVLPLNPNLVDLTESTDEQLVAFTVRDGRSGPGTHLIVASPSASGSTTVISLPRRRLAKVGFIDSERVLLVSAEDMVLRFDLTDLRARINRVRLADPTEIAALALSPGDNPVLAVLDSRNAVSRIDAGKQDKLSADARGPDQHETGRPFAVSQDHGGIALSPIVRTPDNKPHSALMWVNAAGQAVSLPIQPLESEDVVALAAAVPAKRIASATRAGRDDETQIQIWDTESRAVISTLSVGDRVKALALSRDGRWLAAILVVPGSNPKVVNRAGRPIGSDLVLRTWDLQGAAPRDMPAVKLPSDDVNDRQTLEFGAGGRYLVVAGRAKVRMMEWNDGSAAARPNSTYEASSYALAPNEKWFATVDRARGVLLFSLGAIADAPRRLLGDEAGISTLAFTRDSQLLIGGAKDGTVYVWDAATGQARALLISGHRRAITAIGLSADGATMATGDTGGGVALWSIAALRSHPMIEATLCEQVRSNLSFRSWQSFMKDENYRRTCPAVPAGEGVAQALIKEAWSQADRGNATEARKLVGSALGMVEDINSADDLNTLCYWAALAGAGREASNVCERAVKADPDNGLVKDSRGVAFALAGRYADAVADLRAALADQNFPDEERAVRAAWVTALERGVNPLDAKTLRSLRQKEAQNQ